MTKVSPTTASKSAANKGTGNGAGAASVPIANTTGPVTPNATANATEAQEAPKKRGRKKGDGTNAVKRIYHPLLEAAEKVLEKSQKKVMRPTKQLDTVPSDFNPKIHKGLRRADFVDESVFLEHKAQLLELKAKELREQAKDLKTLGGIKDRADAKKMLTLQKRMTELTAKLAGSGKVDVNAIMGKFMTQLQEAQKAAAEQQAAAPQA